MTRLPLIVDLFAGGGGASEAIFRATGRHPTIAVNHNPDAIGVHEANHPTTRHYTCDVFEVDPVLACTVDGELQPVDLMWASPDCTHFSKARGGKPVEKKIRSLADVVVVWAKAVRPRLIHLENVEEFQSWGPVLENGQPCPDSKGLDFRRWVRDLEALGYAVDWKQLVAADYGAPTTRNRLFLIARCDGEPIVWPEPTHASRAKIAKGDLFARTLQPWRSAAGIIDWSQPIPSIFDRKRPLAPKTLARHAKGIKRFIIEAPRPFIVPLTHKGPGRIHDLEDPLRTVTSAHRGEFSLVAPQLIPRYGERPGQEPRARDIAEPYPTVVGTGNGGDLAAAFLTRQFGSTVSGRSLDEPAPTVMADGNGGKTGVVSAIMSSVAYGDDRPRAGLRAWSMEDPVGTVTASNDKTIAAVTMIQNNGGRVGRPVDEPVTTLTDRSTQQTLLAASIDKYYATGVASDITEPLDTVTARGRFGLSAAWMEQANTDMVGHDMAEPVSTIVGKGCTQRLSATRLEEIGAPEGSRRRKVLQFLWDHFGEPTAEEWANPIATAMGRLRFGLVRLGEIVWQIADIGMRMLVPRELFNAQGFRPDYIIDRAAPTPQHPEGRLITKTSQTSMAGNSVSPYPAEASLRANLTFMDLPERVAA